MKRAWRGPDLREPRRLPLHGVGPLPRRHRRRRPPRHALLLPRRQEGIRQAAKGVGLQQDIEVGLRSLNAAPHQPRLRPTQLPERELAGAAEVPAALLDQGHPAVRHRHALRRRDGAGRAQRLRGQLQRAPLRDEAAALREDNSR